MKKKLVVSGIALIAMVALAATVLQTDENFGGVTSFFSSAKYRITVTPYDDAVLAMDFVNKPSITFTNFSNPILFTRTGIVAQVVGLSGSSQTWTNDSTYLRALNVPVGGILMSNSLGIIAIQGSAASWATAQGILLDPTLGVMDITKRKLLDGSGALALNWTNTGEVVITNVLVPQTAYTTNENSQAANFSQGYSLFTTNAAFTFAAPTGVDTTALRAQSTVVLVTNSTAAAVLLTFPAAIHTQGTLYVTNVTACSFFCYAGLFTNCTVLPLW